MMMRLKDAPEYAAHKGTNERKWRNGEIHKDIKVKSQIQQSDNLYVNKSY